MVMEGVVFVAAHTARSQAYAQALARAGLAPAMTLLLRPELVPAPGSHASPPADMAGLPLPRLEQPLGDTIARAGWPCQTLVTGDINDGQVLTTLRSLDARLVIYSGFGGQLVGDALLDAGIPFLHVHSGWLPEFRGSTTLYYTLLKQQRPAASALVLDRHIDEGRILLRRHYPLPPADCDLDLLYDNAIRADLLVRVLRRYQRIGALWAGRRQDPAAGHSYYIIHPVLKHIARLSLHEHVHA